MRDSSTLDKATDRTEIGNPPGKKGSLGDAIIWESLLGHAPDEPLHFVSDDIDYKSKLNKLKMKDFLVII